MASPIITDVMLTTEEQIKERLSSIRLQREAIIIRNNRSSSITAWENKRKAIAKLTSREGALLIRLKEIKQA